MTNKSAKNRKKNRRKKKQYIPKAEELYRDSIEQEILDSLDPIKNAKDGNLFVFDSNLPSAPKKLNRNKTTWADDKLTSKGLGLVLPKHTGKTFQEKRKLNQAELKEIDRRAKSTKKEDGDAEMKKEEEEGEEGVEQKTVKRVKTEAGKKEKTEGKEIYDLWGGANEKPQNPQHSFIQEVLYPPKRPFVHKPVESNLPAVPIPHDAQSYRPAPELHAQIVNDNKEINTKISKRKREAGELQKKLLSKKDFFPRIDANEEEKEGDEAEQPEEIRAIPKRHKTAKEKRQKAKKREIRDQEEREMRTQREQRNIYRIPEILESIEAKEKATEEKQMKRLAAKANMHNVPRASDGIRLKPSKIIPVGKVTRMRSIDTLVNPFKERMLSMKNRGIIMSKTPRLDDAPQYKVVESVTVRDASRADYEKYLKPILDKKF